MIFRGTIEALQSVLGLPDYAKASNVVAFLLEHGAIRVAAAEHQLPPDGTRGRKAKVYDVPSLLSLTVGHGAHDIAELPAEVDGVVDMRPVPDPEAVESAKEKNGPTLTSKFDQLQSQVAQLTALLMAGKVVTVDPPAPATDPK